MFVSEGEVRYAFHPHMIDGGGRRDVEPTKFRLKDSKLGSNRGLF